MYRTEMENAKKRQFVWPDLEPTVMFLDGWLLADGFKSFPEWQMASKYCHDDTRR
jgi:hypothetical protein